MEHTGLAHPRGQIVDVVGGSSLGCLERTLGGFDGGGRPASGGARSCFLWSCWHVVFLFRVFFVLVFYILAVDILALRLSKAGKLTVVVVVSVIIS